MKLDMFSSTEVNTFSLFYGIYQMLGLLVLFMMVCWCAVYEGGLGWRWSSYEINVHPFMMTLGFLYLMSNSILIYRSFKSYSKLRLKQTHAALHIIALIAIIIGLTAIWDYKNARNITNLTSMHSWLGLVTVILFVLQWVYSLLTFLYPGAPLHIRNKSINPHVFFGLTIFIMATATALMGLSNQSSWGTKYKNSGTYANILGLFICLFAGTFIYIVTKTQFKRLDYHV